MSSSKKNSLLLLVFLLLLAIQGQTQPLTQTQRDFAYAVELYTRKNYFEASKVLAKLLKDSPDFVNESQGSAWYLLGKVLMKLDQKARAHRIFKHGLLVLQNAHKFDPRLVQEFVTLTLELKKAEEYSMVTQLIYEFLQEADHKVKTAVLLPFYATMEFLLHEKQRVKVAFSLLNPEVTKKPFHLGKYLLRFWRKEDPTPATVVNERLIEHLQRVNYARQHFAADNLRGFDDRGMIYVKYGKPDRKTSYWRGVVKGDFRPHEIWNYNSIARQLSFFFVDYQKGRGFELADRIDQAILGVATFFERQLLYYEFAKVDAAFYSRLYGDENPYFSDYLAESYRKEGVPVAVTDVLSRVEEIPVQMRMARFLESDGSTRLEIYLGIRRKDLLVKSLDPFLPSDTLNLKITTILQNLNFAPQRIKTYRAASFNGNDSMNEEMLRLQYRMNTEQRLFYLSGQVEDWLVRYGLEYDEQAQADLKMPVLDSQSVPGKLLKMTAFRTPLLKALQLRPDSLLISDIQLSDKIEVSENPSPHKGDLYIEPFPFEKVNRNKLLFLYFEIYGLTLSSDGLARYQISYEAEDVRTKQNLWSKIVSLFSKRGVGRVEMTSEYTAKSSTTSEWIGLDIKSLPPGNTKLKVTVTDLISGHRGVREVLVELF